jgi:hypothetical protein
MKPEDQCVQTQQNEIPSDRFEILRSEKLKDQCVQNPEAQPIGLEEEDLKIDQNITSDAESSDAVEPGLAKKKSEVNFG